MIVIGRRFASVEISREEMEAIETVSNIIDELYDKMGYDLPDEIFNCTNENMLTTKRVLEDMACTFNVANIHDPKSPKYLVVFDD